jgi:hypothetical protein
MSAAGWLLATAYATVMTVLIRAGAAKLASPNMAAIAMSEVWRGRAAPSLGSVRLVSVIELMTTLLVATPAGRRPALVMILALGVGFASAGWLGLERGVRKPCGCFGVASDRPLGIGNVVIGCVLVGFAGLALVVKVPDDGTIFSVATALLAVAGSAGWLLVTVRRQIRNVLRAVAHGDEVTA